MQGNKYLITGNPLVSSTLHFHGLITTLRYVFAQKDFFFLLKRIYLTKKMMLLIKHINSLMMLWIMEKVLLYILYVAIIDQFVFCVPISWKSTTNLCLYIYIFFRFRWTLYKTLQYMHSRRPDLEIRANFFNQLLAFESRLQKNG